MVGESIRDRVLGISDVWPSDSGRMASGIWPYGLWTLAAWRGLICARSPVPQWCPLVVNPCGDARPTMGFSLIGALAGLDQRRQGGRECAVRFSIQLGWDLGTAGPEAVPAVAHTPYPAYLKKTPQAPLNDNNGVGNRQGGRPESRGLYEDKAAGP